MCYDTTKYNIKLLLSVVPETEIQTKT